MKIPRLCLSLLAGTCAASAQNYIQLWQVGADNNSQGEFAQETGGSNTPPGSPAAKDDDYYLAGQYPDPVGVVADSEPTTTNFERALLVVDPANRIHFNLNETVVPTTAMRLTVDLCCSSHGEFQTFSGPIPFDVLFNDNLLGSETTTGTDGAEENYVYDFTAADVAAVPGAGNDNYVTIERSATAGGNWMQFDFVRLEVDSDTLACADPICSFDADQTRIDPGGLVTLTWVTAPGATDLSIDNGVGDVDDLTVDGIGSTLVSPTHNTTYTLTSTVGGDTQTRSVTVNVNVIQSFTSTDFEVPPGTEVFLDWTVDPLASVEIDQGIGNVDADTFNGVGFVSIFPTELETIYTLTATRGDDVETATVRVLVNPFTQLWTLGIDDNSQAEFAQEQGGATPPPGDPAAVDDDYYFAGIYPALGVVAADEPVGNFERALLIVDPRVRIHFNLNAAEAAPDNRFRVRVNVCCSNHNDFQGLSGPIDFLVLFNGVSVLDATTNGANNTDEVFFTDVVTGADVSAIDGENVVTIERRTDQGGSWMQFDQIALETGPPAAPAVDLRITDVSYDPGSGLLDATFTSEVGETYTIETSSGTTALENWSILEADYPAGGATGTTTTYSTTVPYATNPEFYIRVVLPD